MTAKMTVMTVMTARRTAATPAAAPAPACVSSYAAAVIGFFRDLPWPGLIDCNDRLQNSSCLRKQFLMMV